MKDILWFKEINKSNIAEVGGKGASLGEMFNIGLPIPPGFCVSAQAYEKFLEDSGVGKKVYSLLEKLDVENTEALYDAAENVQEIILEADVPPELKVKIKEAYFNMTVDIDVIKATSKDSMKMVKAGSEQAYVAVRSSATAEDLPTASFAGQQSTYLNIRGGDELIKNVKKCWASLFTARAIYYRVKNKFEHSKVFISVIVQKMVDSESAGVMFTRNPSTNEDEIIIEAAFGLGETVVGGSITPDRYVVDKKNFSIKKKEIHEQPWGIVRDPKLARSIKKNLDSEEGKKQKVSDENIKKLGELGVKIEKHYEVPQDIEFAIENGKVLIVQSRPVTTIEKTKEVISKQKELGDKEVILKGLNAGPGMGSGKVKIVHGIEDLSKVQEGDVLVARMTNPDYVAKMKAASAIVTDAGGTTCMGGDTKVLTDKGFMKMKEVYANLSKGEKLLTLSLNSKTNKICWKPILATFKRKAKLWKVQISPALKSNQNFLEVTPDHKFLTLENRKLIKKRVDNIIKESEGVLIADRIDNLLHNNINIEEAYLSGAMFSDGHLCVNNRGGYVTRFTQSLIPEKMEFIQTVNNSFKNLYNENVNTYFRENSGTVTLSCYKKAVHNRLFELKSNIVPLVLSMDEEVLLAFIGGFIDGDGGIGHHQVHITVGDKKEIFLGAIVCACLRLGIAFNVSRDNRDNCYIINFTENVDKLLKYCKRVKGTINRRFGNKWFLSKQIISDVIDEVNHRGRVKHPYLSNNLMISDRYLTKAIIPRIQEKKEEFDRLLKSDFRMNRIKFEEDIGEQDVYNIEVAGDNELDHNYVVFTSRYTPVIVGNCHAAIVGREMGLPVVVGTMKATTVLKDNDEVTVDGYTGNIYKGKVSVEHKGEKIEVEGYVEGEKIETTTEVKVNIDMPEYAEKAAKTNADGVGLLRCEFIILGRKVHPYYLIEQGKKDELVSNLAEDIKKIASKFKGKSVWYRTLDAPTDEFRHLKGGEGEPKEDNPMMGWRSIRRDLDQPELLKAQFEAIKKVHDEGLTNVGVMIPLVTHVEQVKKAKECLKEVGLEPLEEIEFGCMIETVSAVEMIEEICKEGIDFVSIGSNDLTQFVLAVDRNNAKVAKLYDEMHPAVLRQIERVIKTCRENNVEVSICGQAGSRPDMVEWLVKHGIDSISANIDAVGKIRRVVYNTERKMLLKVAREKES